LSGTKIEAQGGALVGAIAVDAGLGAEIRQRAASRTAGSAHPSRRTKKLRSSKDTLTANIYTASDRTALTKLSHTPAKETANVAEYTRWRN
jgi:hypothetical protein